MQDLPNRLSDLLRSKKLKLATAESCTGGLIASALTRIPGASDVFERGFITYSNASKAELLHVPEEMITVHGAVSPEVAKAMAEGALTHSSADIAIAVTGIAGPDGGSEEKPVGLVYFGIAAEAGFSAVLEWHFKGDRSAVQNQAVEKALAYLLETIESKL